MTSRAAVKAKVSSCVIAAAGMLCSTAAFAQSWPVLSDVPAMEKTGAGDVAIIVAIDDYAFLPDVPGATKNAADWEKHLTDGLGVDQVLLLTNQQAVREEILAFAERGAKAVSPDATLWFLFVGHGAPNKDGSDGLLIGADGQQNANSMQSRGVAQKELIAALVKGKQGKTVVVLDACFSGRDASGNALAKGTMPVIAVQPKLNVEKDIVVMSAATSDEFAGDLPGADRPAFSYLLLGGMRGWADDGDGVVTADEAVRYARRELLGISGRQQTPQLAGDKDQVLSRGVAEAKPSAGGVAVIAEPGGEPVVQDQRSVKVQDPKHTDGIPDSPFYVHGALGVGVLGDFGSTGLLADLGAGVKLNAFTGGASEWRFGVRFGFISTANDNVPQPGDTVGSTTVEESDSFPDSRTSAWVVGPEIARAWRSESGPGVFGDSVFVLGLQGLYGNQPSECDQWTFDTSSGSRSFACSSAPQVNGPGAGVSASGQFGPMRLGSQLGFIIDVGVVAGLTAGLTFDI